MSSTLGAIIIEGHVQGLSNLRSLAEHGVPCIVIDKSDCIARHSRYCKSFFLSPNFIEDAFADFLLNLAQKEELHGWVLIPSNDHAVYTLSKHKDRLQKYYKVIFPELSVIDKIYDKLQLIELSEKIGVPVPYTTSFKEDSVISQQKDLRFPVLTKGRNGLTFLKATGKKALLAHNFTELEAQFQLLREKDSLANSFTQELIPFDGSNKTISFTAFCHKGEIVAHWTGVKLREHPIQFGTATFTTNIQVEECLTQSRALLRELQYTGPCEVEYLLDPRDGKYKLIEINPRTWLWVGLAKACGVDYAKMIYDYAQGKPLEPAVATSTPHFWINPYTDLVFSLIAVLKGKLKLGAFIKSLFRSNTVNALFYKGDNKPAYSYLLNTFSFLKNR